MSIKKLKNSKGLLITLACFVVLAIIFVCAVSTAGSKVTEEQAQLLESSLHSAAINAYAVTGRYPTLDEIQTDFGVVVDEEHFNVVYSAFASNIIPEIRVTVREEYR